MIHGQLDIWWHRVKKDCRSHPLRMILELVNWILNVGIGLAMAITAPYPPLLYIYPMWFICLCISISSAITRGSIGLLLASSSMLAIDICGFIALIYHTK
jgi:hypothetical protein